MKVCIHVTFPLIDVDAEVVWRVYDHDRNHSGGDNDVDTVEKFHSLLLAELI
jgi:hypothetical protein